jgi:hypothetical protein
MMSEPILITMTTAFSDPEAAFEWKLLYRFFGLLISCAPSSTWLPCIPPAGGATCLSRAGGPRPT